jgi:hypothetical protein
MGNRSPSPSGEGLGVGAVCLTPSLRTNVIEWSCLQPSLPPPFGDVPGIGDNGVSARDRSDPSYMRPLVNVRKRHVPKAG